VPQRLSRIPGLSRCGFCALPIISSQSRHMNIIGGLDRPSQGSVPVDGAELSCPDDSALTRLCCEKVGFIFEFFNLLPRL
jgi:putative ABC transport system ATP-binding protein